MKGFINNGVQKKNISKYKYSSCYDHKSVLPSVSSRGGKKASSGFTVSKQVTLLQVSVKSFLQATLEPNLLKKNSFPISSCQPFSGNAYWSMAVQEHHITSPDD